MPTPPSADPNRFDEAVRWFRARVPISDEDWDALTAEAQRKAFKVAGVQELDLVSDVWLAIDDALTQGTTIADFKKAIADKLEAAWGGEKPGRLENIFRTNLQLSYSAGREEQLQSPAVRRMRPYWKFSALLDSRTSEICSHAAGVIRPADDPWWSTHTPPLHFQCRSTKIALTEKQAKAAGITANPPEVAPLEGFGGDPRADTWEPDLSKYPAPLRAAFDTRVK